MDTFFKFWTPFWKFRHLFKSFCHHFSSDLMQIIENFLTIWDFLTIFHKMFIRSFHYNIICCKDTLSWVSMKKLPDQTLQFCGIISQSQRVQRKTINVRLERSPLHMEESSLISNYGRLCSRVKTSLFFEVRQKILALLLSQRKLHLGIALFFPTSQGLMVLPFHILFRTGKTYQIRILDPIVHPTAL